MIRMTLADIARAVDGTLRLFGDATEATEVDGVVDTDSREMQPGSVFVAKPGEATDGHLFVAAAAYLVISRRRHPERETDVYTSEPPSQASNDHSQDAEPA